MGVVRFGWFFNSCVYLLDWLFTKEMWGVCNLLGKPLITLRSREERRHRLERSTSNP